MLLVLKEKKKREREQNGNEVLLTNSFQTCIDSQPSWIGSSVREEARENVGSTLSSGEKAMLFYLDGSIA